jgi:hypothetical protein
MPLSAPTARLTDEGACAMIRNDYGFSYRHEVGVPVASQFLFLFTLFQQQVADFAKKLLQSYDKARDLGTAKPMPTMTMDNFTNLTPRHRAAAMVEPLVIIGSAIKPTIAHRDR